MPAPLGIGADALAERARQNRALIGMPSQADILRTGPALYEAQGLAPQIGSEFPAIGRFPFTVTTGEGPYFSEFYPPWESHNPIPGQTTIELQGKGQQLRGLELKHLLTGEMLHLLGAVDPATGRPVDPTFRQLKLGFGGMLTPEQSAMDRRAYSAAGETRPYSDWMDHSRLDAYLRGYIVNQWPRDMYTPEQTSHLEQMNQYLRGPVQVPAQR